MGYLLYVVLQNYGIAPGVFMGFRRPTDPISDGERAFITAALRKAREEGDVPIRQKNFAKPKRGAG